MNKMLIKNYKQFKDSKQKKATLKRYFESFLPEVVYRSTRIEHPNVTKKQVQSHLSS